MIHQPTDPPYRDKPRVCRVCRALLPDLATIEQECPGEPIPATVDPESYAAQLLLQIGYLRGLIERLPNGDAPMLRAILATLTALLAPDRRREWIESLHLAEAERADGAPPIERTRPGDP
jgi:hypothetical protein